MNYLDDYRRIPWLLSTPFSHHSDEEEEDPPIDPTLKNAAVWGSFPRERKYLIIKMEEKFLDKAATFLEKHFFKKNILCKGVSLMWERAAVEYYKDLMKYWMRDRTSLLAIEEGNERLVGILIARIIYLTPDANLDIDYSRICICNKRVQEIQDLRVSMRKEIIRVTALERAENSCFEIKLFCVDRIEMMADEIEDRLIKCLYVLASESRIPLIIGVMTSLHEQQQMKAHGFKSAYTARYDELKKRGHIIFPSDEKETSIVGFYKFMDKKAYRTAYMEESIMPTRLPSDELPVESFSEDSLTDAEEEPYRAVKLYLDYEDQSKESGSEIIFEENDEDESYKDIKKLMREYQEECEDLEEEWDDEEYEDEYGEFEELSAVFGLFGDVGEEEPEIDSEQGSLQHLDPERGSENGQIGRDSEEL